MVNESNKTKIISNNNMVNKTWQVGENTSGYPIQLLYDYFTLTLSL